MHEGACGHKVRIWRRTGRGEKGEKGIFAYFNVVRMRRLFKNNAERIRVFAKILILRFWGEDDILYLDTVYISIFAERY